MFKKGNQETKKCLNRWRESTSFGLNINSSIINKWLLYSKILYNHLISIVKWEMLQVKYGLIKVFKVIKIRLMWIITVNTPRLITLNLIWFINEVYWND